MAVHARQRANEIVVERAGGNAYVNGADFDFAAGAPPKPGYIKLVTPDGGCARSPATSSSRTGWSSPGRPDADHLRVVRGPADRVRHRRRRRAVGAAGLRRGPRAGRHLPGRRGRRCGCPPAGSLSPASPRAARSCSASSSRRTGAFALMLGGPDRRTLSSAPRVAPADHVSPQPRTAGHGAAHRRILALRREVPARPPVTASRGRPPRPGPPRPIRHAAPCGRPGTWAACPARPTRTRRSTDPPASQGPVREGLRGRLQNERGSEWSSGPGRRASARTAPCSPRARRAAGPCRPRRRGRQRTRRRTPTPRPRRPGRCRPAEALGEDPPPRQPAVGADVERGQPPGTTRR